LNPQNTVYQLPSILTYIYLQQTSSTNDFATDRLSINGPNEDICIYTYNQSEGRGQIGRKWFGDTDKNIACSYIKHFDHLAVQQQFYLNMAFSLAIHDLISIYVDQPVNIKWPNDIYVNDKKIAGILIQNMLRSDIIPSAILGIGLNVNTYEFPENLPNPTSLSLECRKEFDLLDVIKALSLCIQERLNNFLSRSNEIREEYVALMYRKDTVSPFMNNGQLIKGKIKGVLEEGHLVLEVDGYDQHFGFRELTYVI